MSHSQTCDRCDNPATVYLTEISDGKPHRFHLCQLCAKSVDGDLSRKERIDGRNRKQTMCSFCGRNSDQTGPMVQGPKSIHICSACTEISYNIFRHEQLTTPEEFA